MRAFLSAIGLTIVIGFTAQEAWALGFETFGNEPFPAANYGDWPGVMPVINNRNRVYHHWVNGNEHFCFRGDTGAVNEALQQFALIESKPLQVVLRPGPGIAGTFDQKKKIACDWEFGLVGGIARSSPTLDQEPTLTIYISKTLPVEKLVIPPGLTIATIPELKDRAALLLKSSDMTTRGWGAGKLARLDPYDSRSVETIGALLKDDETWVRGNAVGALSNFGAKARGKIAELRKAAQTGDKDLQARIEKLIGEIESAPEKIEAEREHCETLRQIDKYVDRLRKRE